MQDYLVEMLECPVCHGTLSWSIGTRHGAAIVDAEATCAACAAAYPIREGIGVFLTPDLPRHDLWEHVESGLERYLHSRPDLEQRLMEAPPEALNPADLLFRSMVREERGQPALARAESQTALRGLYTPEYRACYASQIDYLVERLNGYPGPIVDLASGRGALAETLAERLDNPIVVTDFSPVVLRRDRRMMEHLGLTDRVSLLAFDARRTPFTTGAVQRMTSNLGLGNVEEPGNLLAELRRISSGELLAITHFYPEHDAAHAEVLASNHFISRDRTVSRFRESGWRVSLENECRGQAEPTPQGEILEGFAVDGLPLAPVTLEWCVLVAG